MPKKPLGPFHFQEFKLEHKRSAHKIGTDAVLLAAWLKPMEAPKRIFDFGSGSGVISFILAQGFKEAAIEGIEIDHDSWLEAEENRLNNPFKDQVKFHQGDLLDWDSPHLFDLIVSNPPYFSAQSLAPDKRRAQARSASEKTFMAWMEKLKSLLTNRGSLALILPSHNWENQQVAFAEIGLFPQKICWINHHEGANYSRILVELSFKKQETEESSLCLYEGPKSHRRTPAHQKLVADLLLLP
ncbi:MAG: methyltransferase [Bacteroidetes bacterium]|nr:methyltransferase [Bacteroidota bacterium]